MADKIRQATAHKAVEMFLRFIVLFPGDVARSRITFLAMTNSLKLININGGRYKTMKTRINNAGLTDKPSLETTYMTAGGMSNVKKRVSSLRLVTDVW